MDVWQKLFALKTDCWKNISILNIIFIYTLYGYYNNYEHTHKQKHIIIYHKAWTSLACTKKDKIQFFSMSHTQSLGDSYPLLNSMEKLLTYLMPSRKRAERRKERIRWNPSKADTIGTKNFVRCSEVSLAQVVSSPDPTPWDETIASSGD